MEGDWTKHKESIGKVIIPNALIRAADDTTVDIWDGERNGQSPRKLNCLIHVYAAGVVLNRLARESNKRMKSTLEKQSKRASEKVRTRLAESRKWYSRLLVEMSRQQDGKKLTRRTGRNRDILQKKYGSMAMSKLTIEHFKLWDVIKIQTERFSSQE